jgi:hypothetical protein
MRLILHIESRETYRPSTLLEATSVSLIRILDLIIRVGEIYLLHECIDLKN